MIVEGDVHRRSMAHHGPSSVTDAPQPRVSRSHCTQMSDVQPELELWQKVRRTDNYSGEPDPEDWVPDGDRLSLINGGGSGLGYHSASYSEADNARFLVPWDEWKAMSMEQRTGGGVRPSLVTLDKVPVWADKPGPAAPAEV